MPELPEVETVVRTVAPCLTGRRIVSATQLAARAMETDPATVLTGATVLSVRRHGKHIVFELDRGTLDIHLGMTGRLLLDAVPTPYTRAVIQFDGCRLQFDDIRQFGRMVWTPDAPEHLSRLGPDPLEITAEQLAARLRARRGRIKPLLLRQTFLRGLGNIYSDEVLFHARIHPLAVARRLSAARIGRLHSMIRLVLQRAIEQGGSSISDYVDSKGRQGSYQLSHCVYGRQGLPCVRCGTAIRRRVVAQRGTYYCPRCQRT